MKYHYQAGVIVPFAQKHYKQLILAVAAIFMASMAMLTAISNAAVTTEVVTGNTAAGENQPGWLFNRDVSTSSPYEFNNDAASIGTGSLYIEPIGATPANKFIAENFINAPIAEVDSISYDFKIGSGGVDTEEEHFYMNVYANFGSSPDNKFYDCRYNVVPTTGSTAAFTTVTFDPTVAYPVTQSGTSPFACPTTPADMELSSAGSNIRAFALNVGDTSASDEGLDGYLDNVVVTFNNTDQTVYDFEVDTTAPTANLVFPTPGPAATSFDVVFSESVVEAEAEDAANYFLNNWPGAGGSGDLAGDATVVYNDATKTATVTLTNPGWYVSPEQQWGVQNVTDLAGNVINPNPTTEYSTPLVDPDAPGTPTTASPTLSTTQTWTWTAATDPGGVEASGVASYEVSIDGGAWTNVGNVLTYSTSFTNGTHTLSVRAIDNAGNVGTEATGTVVVFGDKDDCKDGGWALLGTTFKNQGDCVSYFATGGRNLPAGETTTTTNARGRR